MGVKDFILLNQCRNQVDVITDSKESEYTDLYCRSGILKERAKESKTEFFHEGGGSQLDFYQTGEDCMHIRIIFELLQLPTTLFPRK